MLEKHDPDHTKSSSPPRPLAASSSARLHDDASSTMLQRGPTRDKNLHDVLDIAEGGSDLDRIPLVAPNKLATAAVAGSNGILDEPEGGPLSTRDKRALALLVALCASRPFHPARSRPRGPSLTSLLLPLLPSAYQPRRLQTSCRVSPSGSHSARSRSSCAQSCRTRRSASSPCAPTRTRSSSCGRPSSTRSSARNSAAARAGSCPSRPSSA